MCIDCEAGPGAKGFPGGAACDAIAGRCKDSFCTDVCLGDAVWRCSASWKDKSDDAAARTNGPLTAPEETALCAQTKALACSSMGCCSTVDEPEGKPSLEAGATSRDARGRIDPLREWVVAQEAMTASSLGTGGSDSMALMLPAPALPLQRCEHDPADRATADLLCKTCQGRLALKLEAVGEASRCAALGPVSRDNDPFTQDDAEPSQKSLYDRCAAAAPDILGGIIGSPVKAWQSERLCRCAGCCSDPPASKPGKLAFAAADCPFPGYALV